MAEAIRRELLAEEMAAAEREDSRPSAAELAADEAFARDSSAAQDP